MCVVGGGRGGRGRMCVRVCDRQVRHTDTHTHTHRRRHMPSLFLAVRQITSLSPSLFGCCWGSAVVHVAALASFSTEKQVMSYCARTRVGRITIRPLMNRYGSVIVCVMYERVWQMQSKFILTVTISRNWRESKREREREYKFVPRGTWSGIKIAAQGIRK